MYQDSMMELSENRNELFNELVNYCMISGEIDESLYDVYVGADFLEAGKKASVELLNRLAPSQIAQDPKAANQEMGQIVKQMGITPIRK